MSFWLFWNRGVLNYELDTLLDRCQQYARYAWRNNQPARLHKWEQRAAEVQRLMNQ